MNDIHSCSYYCDRPECIKAQRDELREKLLNREWQRMTVEEFFECVRSSNDLIFIAQAIEAKLKEKNA